MKPAISSFLALGIFLTASAVASAADVAGNALRFDGNDTVMIPDSADFDGHTSLTVEMWVRYDTLDQGSYLFDQFGPAPAKEGEWLVMVTAQTYGHPSLTGYFRYPGVDRASASQHVNVTDGDWHHVAVARNGAEIYLLVDGKLDVAGSFGGSLSMRASLPIHLGSRGGFESFLHGELDEVRFWNYARTPEQIQASYNRTLDPTTPGLIGYWRFDEAPGNQNVFDAAPPFNDGTLGSTASVGSDDPARVISTAPIIGLVGECNGNGVADTIDIAAGTSQDCNLNGVPDECDLAGRFSADANTNGLVDECDVPGDLDDDGDVDGLDFNVFLNGYGLSVGDLQFNAALDFNGDGVVGILDYQFWLMAYRAFVGNALAAAPAGRLGDVDFDEDIDLVDFKGLQACMVGRPERVFPCTIKFDFDRNGQVNMQDVAAFTAEVTGPS